jgi:tyrosyl-tRNA synthetase
MAGAEGSHGTPADAAAINSAKERLATEITALVHSREEADKARDAAQALFAKGAGGGANPDAMPSGELPAADLQAGIPVLDLFQRAGLSASKSEARRLVQQGGARINDIKVADIDTVIDDSWRPGAGDSGVSATTGGENGGATDALLLRAGKKRYFRFIVT